MAHRFEWIGMSADGNSITLKRFNGSVPCPSYATEEWFAANADAVRTGLVVDTETTGLNSETDTIIEIAYRKFRFHRSTGEILSVEAPYVSLQDPGVALSPRVQFVTGLTDEQLKGKQIDWKKVDADLFSADIILAHNAGFDRPFIEKKCPSAARKVWACSFSQIDWQSKGYPILKLEVLCLYHGFYTDAHRALSDIDALLYLISMKDKQSGSPYLMEILNNARRHTALVIAKNSPFETKNQLKERGYSWNANLRSWQKQIYQDQLKDETSWLEQSIYQKRNTLSPFPGEIREIPLTETFRNVSE